MSKYNGGLLASSGSGAGLTATGATVSVDVSGAEGSFNMGLSSSVALVGTWTVELSADGTNYQPFGTALTAVGTVKVDVPAKFARWKCSAYTSGTAICTYGWRDEDKLG